MKIEEAKVLVIDDDKVMMMFVTNLLARLGIEQVQEAANGEAGLALVEGFHPDVILSDIHMKPMDGLEFVKQLRGHPVAAIRKTPVLIMSADSGTEVSNVSVPLGIAGYIVKPPQISALKLKLEHVLKFRAPSPLASA